jgi:cardiolipin synthase A/B
MHLPDLTLPHWLTLHGLVTVVAVLIYVVSSHLTHQRRQPAAAIAWILFILLLPYLALPAFLSFGSRKLPRPRPPARTDLPKVRTTDAWAIETALALGQPAPAPYSDLNVHVDGVHARNSLLEIIAAAESSIDLCTFIIGRDELGQAVIDALCRKAERGVRVRLLLDGLGKLMVRQPDLRVLMAAGGECALFVPPLRSPLKGRSNLRDHRKLLVTDAERVTARLWCGGRNLASEYFDGARGTPPWRDLSFDLRGPLVGQASRLFERDWAFANGKSQDTGLRRWSFKPPPIEVNCGLDGAQLVASGPDQADDTIYTLMVAAAYRARTRIALATPYFVPEAALLMALCMAARRGVAVDLLLPDRSNHRLSDLARERSLRSLAQAGGRIWLAPTMMHAKLVLTDDTLALAGSANLDTRSLFLNYELMCAFHKTADVRRFADWFDQERHTARAYVATAPGFMRDLAEGMLLWVGFQL